MLSLWVMNRLTLSCAVDAVNNRIDDDSRRDVFCCRIVGERTRDVAAKASVSDPIPFSACESSGVGIWARISV